MSALLRGCDAALATHAAFLLGRWLSDAQRWAAPGPHEAAERALYERNARLQITLWGPTGSTVRATAQANALSFSKLILNCTVLSDLLISHSFLIDCWLRWKAVEWYSSRVSLQIILVCCNNAFSFTKHSTKNSCKYIIFFERVHMLFSTRILYELILHHKVITV